MYSNIHQIPFAMFSFHFASEDTEALVSFCPFKKKTGQGTDKRNNQCRNLILARVPNSFAFHTFVVSFGVVVYCALGARASVTSVTEMHGHHSLCMRAACEEMWTCAGDDLIRGCPLLVRCYTIPAFSSNSTEVCGVAKSLQSVCAMMIFGRAPPNVGSGRVQTSVRSFASSTATFLCSSSRASVWCL
jgi:hypothetical protein